jgi:hypothetical protein
MNIPQHIENLDRHEEIGFQRNNLSKLDTLNNKIDGLSGAINNSSIGDANVRLQTFNYGYDSVNGQARALKVDSTGRLECNVADIELHTGDIALSVDGLETLIGTTNTKLQSDLDFAGQPNNIGDGQNMKRVMNYGHDSAGGQQRPLKVNTSGELSVAVSSTTLPTGAATESTLNDVKTSVQLLDDVVTVQNAAHPSKANAVGGRYYVDNTFRDIRVDNIGKVIVDSPSGSDINLRIDAISNGQTQNGDGTGNKPGVMLDALNTNLISLNNKFVGGQTTTGMATAQNQQVVDLTLQGLGDDLTDIKNGQTSGTQQAKMMGSEDGSTSGTQRQLHVNSSGQIQIDGASVISVAPSNSFNSDNASHLNSFAVGLRARTDITDHSSGKFLLADSTGRLAVINKTGVVNHSEVSYISGQSISGSGTHEGASITVDANTKAFYAEFNFSHTGIKYEVMASIDGTNFFSTGVEFNTGGLSPATLTGLNTILGTSTQATGFPPFIKFKFSNSDSSAQTATLSYVQQIS